MRCCILFGSDSKISLLGVLGIKTKDVIGIVGLVGSLLLPQQRDEDFKRALVSQNLDTEAPLRYRLQNLEFVEHTRIARLNFVKIRTYRTIERYVQRDNQKYKIYSDWKEKESKVPVITLKLTNNVLENLLNSDFLIRNDIVKRQEAADLISEYALDILYELIDVLGKDNLMPSWMKKSLLTTEMNKKIELLQSKRAKCKKNIRSADDKIDQLNQQNAELYNKIQKISNSRENKFLFILFSILSLGIFAFINSKKRLEQLTAQFDESKQSSNLQIASIKSEIENNIDLLKTYGEDIEKIETEYDKRINLVVPLSDYIEETQDFIPLKELSGIDYQKIKGVYIIRNRELDKFYIGQSKDVLKRLKDHFTGTQPKNIIFAEDYYNSNFENKNELFEFKIETLNTKDELDSRERELIAEYDSFNNGYNRTAGNY